MGEYPTDFPVPQDQGGPGAGSPVGGFGGNPTADRTAHRAVVETSGKAPVLLVHGNGGAADIQPWDMLDVNLMLLVAGYPPELIWAPSYLGPGTVDLFTPHTNNTMTSGITSRPSAVISTLKSSTSLPTPSAAR